MYEVVLPPLYCQSDCIIAGCLHDTFSYLLWSDAGLMHYDHDAQSSS